MTTSTPATSNPTLVDAQGNPLKSSGPQILRPTFPKLSFDKVMKTFPLEKPRPIQEQAIRDACDAYNQGAKFVVSEVPTGGGKSGIAAALSIAMGRSWLLTLTQQLQQQYLRDFKSKGFEELLGRAKFSCYQGGADITCKDGKEMFEGKAACKKDLCPYQVQKERALGAHFTVANYHSYLFNVGLGAGKAKKKKKGRAVENEDYDNPGDQQRDLTVIDECHAAEDFLLEQASVSVRLGKLTTWAPSIFPLMPLPYPKTPSDPLSEEAGPYIDWIREELLPKLRDYVEVSTKRGILPTKTKEELTGLMKQLNGVLENTDDDWVPERMETKARNGTRTTDWFALKPLKVARYGRWLTGFGDRLLLMSGTVLDTYQLVTSLGLNHEDGQVFTYDSPFPVENRPIYVGNLSMKMKERGDNWPAMVSMAGNLMKEHAQQKGLILCSSNEMLEYIMKNLPLDQSRRCIRATGEDRVQRYEQHLRSVTPSVLIASGYWEGADLAGDACRFQIIPAVPRAMWQGQIMRRAQKQKGWYEWKNYCKLLQGFGRGVRSEDDTCVTYLFDREFRTELAKGEKSLIPKWIRVACQLVD